MRYKVFRGMMCRIPLNLQLFAEGGGIGDGGGNGGGGTGDGSGNGGDGEGTGGKLSFEDFLKDGNQDEYDRRVQAAIDAAVEKEKAKWEALEDDKLSEAEKLAKMTKEEKAQYLAQKREKELIDREAAVTRKELMAEARNTLSEKGLPLELAEILNYKDADACRASMETVQKAFQKAVEAAVEEKLKGGKPPKKAPEDENALEKQIYDLMKGR